MTHLGLQVQLTGGWVLATVLVGLGVTLLIELAVYFDVFGRLILDVLIPLQEATHGWLQPSPP